MRSLSILLLIMIVYMACQNETEKPILDVENREIDLGDIKFDSSYKLRYKIKNLGNANLKIDTITSSCGCSVPQVNKKVIKPSDSATVLVTYSPVDSGQFKKTLVIKSNTDSIFTILSFKGVAIMNNN